jgi:hypothetical protein
MIIQQTQIVTNGDMSLPINSFGIHMNMFNGRSITNCAIQAIFNGPTPNGTFKLQISCDPVDVPIGTDQGTDNPAIDPAINVVNWSDYTGSMAAVVGPGTFIWNIFNPGYRWLRLVFTPGVGSVGTLLEANFTGKRLI